MRRPADADAVQGLIALRDGQILDLIAATETALGQHRRLRQSNVGQVGHIAELNVVDALRHGERGDAAFVRDAFGRDDERFQPVGQDQLVHAVQIVLDAHHLRAGADGQLGGVLPALAAKKHAAAVELRPVGKPLIPLGGINAGQFHIAQRRREGEALDVRAVVKRGVLQRGQTVGQVQARQPRTLTESSVADDLQALVQRDGGQPRAAGKGTVVDARDAAGNVHRGQGGALIERRRADQLDARRNGHAGNIRAPEGVGADGLHGVGNGGRLALALIGEQLPLPDEEVRRTVVIKPIIVKRAELPGKGADAVGRPRAECPAVQERMLALDGDVGQIRARCKRAAADLRHARRNRDLFQIVVVVKRPLADGFQALRQDDLAQRGVRLGTPVVAVVECVVCNVGHGVRERDLAHNDIGVAVTLSRVEALDADDGIPVDGGRHHDLRFVPIVGCDLDGVARDKAVRVSISVFVRQLLFPEGMCRRQQRQQHGQHQQQGKQSSFHDVLRMQASFLSQD